ncbi:sensor histidine kinase [Anaerobacillus alkaliphilus]|uniref:histidine kinase n=1 Tax=Anaerobacillus alkaliphilus TaxID=1548597 RepID=A0A4Q0VP84_9BACI|nr:sensor histidine kinase [Anaerobacillus alkaliphilus]RXI98256.1 sensor histidine kinase [Anaerobacillus alkaliphilus]
MNINKKKPVQRLTGIQWHIFKIQWRIVLTISGVFCFGLLITATFIQNIPSLYERYNQISSLTLFSNSFFYGVFFATSYVFLVCLLCSLIYSIPLARNIKKQLEKLIDAATIFTRGKLTTRVEQDVDHEFSLLAEQFNAMANHYEKQVVSLQKLLSENSRLIEQAEQAASLEERRKLARDLHDAVSQQLFAISMTMAAMPRLLEKNPEQAKVVFTDIEKMVNNAQQELRALIMHLRPVTLDGKSFYEGLQSLFTELAIKNKHLKIELENNSETTLPSRMEDQLFRVIQEAISNMLRHSKATSFIMKSFEKDGRLFIILEDNGIGFYVDEMEKKGSYGLTSMKERLIELGGNLTVLSYPNKGTKLELRIPIQGVSEQLEGERNE